MEVYSWRMQNKSIKISSDIVPEETIIRAIYFVRGQKVMIDTNLAKLYQVKTKVLIQAVKRNIDRFPIDFMFQLNDKEHESLRSQIVTSNEEKGRGGRRYLPYVFTEHGVSMLSSILNSRRAVQLNIFIIRAFIKLRELLATNKELAHKVEELENNQKKFGEQLTVVYSMIKRMIEEPPKPKHPIGFAVNPKISTK